MYFLCRKLCDKLSVNVSAMLLFTYTAYYVSVCVCSNVFTHSLRITNALTTADAYVSVTTLTIPISLILVNKFKRLKWISS